MIEKGKNQRNLESQNRQFWKRIWTCHSRGPQSGRGPWSQIWPRSNPKKSSRPPSQPSQLHSTKPVPNLTTQNWTSKNRPQNTSPNEPQANPKAHFQRSTFWCRDLWHPKEKIGIIKKITRNPTFSVTFTWPDRLLRSPPGIEVNLAIIIMVVERKSLKGRGWGRNPPLDWTSPRKLNRLASCSSDTYNLVWIYYIWFLSINI